MPCWRSGSLRHPGILGCGNGLEWEPGSHRPGDLLLQHTVQGANIAGALGRQLVDYRGFRTLRKVGSPLVYQLPLIRQVLVQHVAAEG